MTTYVTHSDGYTSFERRWGRNYERAICEFGETLVDLPPQHKKLPEAGLRTQECSWLGKASETGENLRHATPIVRKETIYTRRRTTDPDVNFTTARQTHRHTHTQTERQRQTHGHRRLDADTQHPDPQTRRPADAQAQSHRHTQTHRDRRTETHRHTHTHRHAETHTQTHTHRHTHRHTDAERQD